MAEWLWDSVKALFKTPQAEKAEKAAAEVVSAVLSGETANDMVRKELLLKELDPSDIRAFAQVSRGSHERFARTVDEKYRLLIDAELRGPLRNQSLPFVAELLAAKPVWEAKRPRDHSFYKHVYFVASLLQRMLKVNMALEARYSDVVVLAGPGIIGGHGHNGHYHGLAGGASRGMLSAWGIRQGPYNDRDVQRFLLPAFGWLDNFLVPVHSTALSTLRKPADGTYIGRSVEVVHDIMIPRRLAAFRSLVVEVPLIGRTQFTRSARVIAHHGPFRSADIAAGGRDVITVDTRLPRAEDGSDIVVVLLQYEDDWPARGPSVPAEKKDAPPAPVVRLVAQIIKLSVVAVDNGGAEENQLRVSSSGITEIVDFLPSVRFSDSFNVERLRKLDARELSVFEGNTSFFGNAGWIRYLATAGVKAPTLAVDHKKVVSVLDLVRTLADDPRTAYTFLITALERDESDEAQMREVFVRYTRCVTCAERATHVYDDGSDGFCAQHLPSS